MIDYFYDSYNECRKEFIASYNFNDSKFSQYKASFKGSKNENLYIDAVLVNPNRSKDLLIMASGTHGVEGFIGSGCQIYFLRELAKLYPNNSFLLVHAVNPYGFSACRRGNENNVDINRNFVEDYKIENGQYHKYHKILTMKNKSRYRYIKLLSFLVLSIVLNRKKEIQDAITKGQYLFKDGLFYGGNKKEWSNVIWCEILNKHANDYTLHLIDIHSGLGKSGIGYLLNQNTNKTQARSMGAFFDNKLINSFEDNKISSSLTGTLASTVVRTDSNSALVLEFGTYSAIKILITLCQDNWHNEQSVSYKSNKVISKKMKNCFYIQDYRYKKNILQKFKKTVDMYIQFINKK